MLPRDVVSLAYFAALQTARTPQDRAEMHFFDDFMATQLQQLRFASDRATAFLMAQDPSLTSGEAERARLRIIDELQAGKLRLESSVEAEIDGMFLGLNGAVSQLATEADGRWSRSTKGLRSFCRTRATRAMTRHRRYRELRQASSAPTPLRLSFPSAQHTLS